MDLVGSIGYMQGGLSETIYLDQGDCDVAYIPGDLIIDLLGKQVVHSEDLLICKIIIVGLFCNTPPITYIQPSCLKADWTPRHDGNSGISSPSRCPVLQETSIRYIGAVQPVDRDAV